MPGKLEPMRGEHSFALVLPGSLRRGSSRKTPTLVQAALAVPAGCWRTFSNIFSFISFAVGSALCVPTIQPVSIWIYDGATAIAPKHVHHRTLASGAQAGGLRDCLVRVLDIDEQARGRR